MTHYPLFLDGARKGAQTITIISHCSAQKGKVSFPCFSQEVSISTCLPEKDISSHAAVYAQITP